MLKKNGEEAGEVADIEELLGLALGCIGMSVDDFARCTPAEFQMVAEQWRKRADAVERGEWERSRWLALCMLQPWSKKRLKAEDVCVFPWDKKQETPPDRQLSAEEQRARYEVAKRRYGIG